MGQTLSLRRENTDRHHRTTQRSSWGQPWITFRRFISQTVRRIKCTIKSNAEAVQAWVQDQLDSIAFSTLIDTARIIFHGVFRLLGFVLRPIIATVSWITRACMAIVRFILTIVGFFFFLWVIVAGIALFLLLPTPVQIVLISLAVLLWILLMVVGMSFETIRYLASHAFDCLSSANGRAEWWIMLLGRIGCIAAILAHFIGPEIFVVPGLAFSALIIYAVSPLVEWLFDRNLFDIRNPPAGNYIQIQLQKAIKELYERLRIGLRAFFRGLIPSRLAPVIVIIIIISLLGPGAITIPHFISVVLGSILALRRDPVIGPHMEGFFAGVLEVADPILERLLSLFGLNRTQVNEWMHFFHSDLMRIFSTVIIAIPLQYILGETLEQLPGGLAVVVSIVMAIVAALIMIFRARREFKHGGRLRDEEASLSYDPNRGVPVYCSQRAAFGSANHQVLIIDYQDIGTYKYELSMPRGDGQAQANYSCSPISRNRAQRTVPLNNSGDDFYVYLIGWTTLSHTDVHTFCTTLMPWSYSSMTSNCQHFIRRVGNHIVTARALDWAFFITREETPYQTWLLSQWRIKWPIWVLDAAIAFYLPPYVIVREALY